MADNIGSSQTSGTTDYLYRVFFTDDNNGTAVGFLSGTILHTTDGGAHWVIQNSGTSEGLLGVAFTDANTGTVVGGSGTILHTTDGGQNWAPQTSGTTNQLRAVAFADANNGTIVGELGTILRTTDGGQTWISQTSGVSETLLSVTLTDADHGTAVGQLGTILKTSDGGATWISQESGTNQDLYDVSFPEATVGTAVGGFGAILRTVASDSNPCPQPVSYWKHNSALWPVQSLDLGSQSYSKNELKGILTTKVWKPDASLVLGGELIAAKLNVANGSDPALVSGVIEEADGLLSGYAGKLPYDVERSSETGKAMVKEAAMLYRYNRGDLTPDCTP